VFSAFLVVILIVAVGTRATDALRVKQQKTILENLPESEAVRYYIVLRARVRKVNVLRVIALASVVVLFYSYKRHYAGPPPAATPVTQKR
jgi:hypothetical protein